MEYLIKPVSEEEYPECINVIRAAFLTVACELRLTRENAPTNPAFIELRHLLRMKDSGIRMFGLLVEGRYSGFAALEKLTESDYSIRRLAVLPELRHQGFGKALIRHLTGIAGSEGGKLIKIGVINENTVLKDWYLKLGFKETELKKYDHQPFTVCFMELEI